MTLHEALKTLIPLHFTSLLEVMIVELMCPALSNILFTVHVVCDYFSGMRI